MSQTTRLLVLVLALAAGCSRDPSPAQRLPLPSMPTGAPDGTRSRESTAPARRLDGGPAAPLRAEPRPLTRFTLVPVGEAAVGAARASLEPLRATYVAYGFDLASAERAFPEAADCAELLTRLVPPPGTLFVFDGPVRCSTRFGTVNTVLGTGLVPLGSLGPTGAVRARRLTAVLTSMVGEILGLSMPCSDGKTCCALRTAPDLKVLDARAVAPCPAHASELDRIREAAGMQ